MRSRARLFVLAAALTGVAAVVPAGTASATGAGDVSFRVTGTLPTFPCPNGCFAAFDGTGTGSGHATTMVNGVPHAATFTIVSGTVEGTAEYTEPGFPFCPLMMPFMPMK